MTDTKNSVVTAGYLPLDIVSHRGEFWHSAGGTAGNVAAVLGFLGWDAAVIADLGDDAAGRFVRRDLQKANVSVGYLRLCADRSTPRIVHEINSSGHRYLFRCSNCARTFPSSRPLRLSRAQELARVIPTPRVFFFDRINAGTVLLAEHFKSSGSVVVLEPSRQARLDLMKRAVLAADVVKHADDRKTGVEQFEPSSARQIQTSCR